MDRQDEIKIKQDEIAAKERQKQAITGLHNAMVAPRFIDRSLGSYLAENAGQKKALSDARWFIENAAQSVGLIFLGNNGTGKNHLAAGIVKEFLTRGKTALMTEAVKVVRKIKESWRREGQTESEVIEVYTKIDLLVIDECGVQFGSDTERMYLTEIINDRYNACLSTILIGNLTIEKLTQVIGERVIDRFREGGKVTLFDWTSYRGQKK